MRRPVSPPSIFNFQTNMAETAAFLEKIRKGFSNPLHKGKLGGFVDRRKSKPRISGYADFSKISDIDTASAVVLTAEYDRVSKIRGQVPPCINLDDWHESVFTKLYEIGFFETIGLSEDTRPQISETSNTMVMRLVTMKKNEKMAEVDAHLTELGQFLHADKETFEETTREILTAITEAIANVTNHAYPLDHQFKIPHIDQLWVAASANKETRELSIVVYDQGATIPVTYRLQEWSEKAKDLFRKLKGFDFLHGDISQRQDDGVFIEVAMKHGNSQTGQKHRGQGLPQMRALLQRVGNGSMSIISRTGWCKFGADETVENGTMPTSIGGTLVQWNLKV